MEEENHFSAIFITPPLLITSHAHAHTQQHLAGMAASPSSSPYLKWAEKLAPPRGFGAEMLQHKREEEAKERERVAEEAREREEARVRAEESAEKRDLANEIEWTSYEYQGEHAPPTIVLNDRTRVVGPDGTFKCFVLDAGKKAGVKDGK